MDNYWFTTDDYLLCHKVACKMSNPTWRDLEADERTIFCSRMMMMCVNPRTMEIKDMDKYIFWSEEAKKALAEKEQLSE